MTMPALEPRPTLPAIVLLLERHRDALERYAHCLEDAGLWVATTRVAAEVVAAAEELIPDIIVADIDRLQGDAAAEAVDALKHHGALGRVPVIALAPPAAEVPGADTVLFKPVAPVLLLARTRALLVKSRAMRSRANDLMERGRHLMERSSQLRDASAAAQGAERVCPDCGSPLDWIERGRIGGVTFDYYRWCVKGCGLFCFDCDESSWLKLA